jgi:hypothetical protein
MRSSSETTRVHHAVRRRGAKKFRPCFQGGQRRPGDFGRERREFAGGLRPDWTLPRSSCLARCSSCGGAALPCRYVSRWGERGASMSSSHQRAATVTRHAQRRPSPKSHLIMMFSEDELGRRSIAAPLDAIGAPEPGPQRVDQRFGAIISLRQFFWLWRV